jgi:rhodanese-related sulfurtransferase
MSRIFLIILVFCSAAMGFKSLSQDTLANWLKTNPPFDFVLIDVRTVSEVASSGMIGNARCKPYNVPWTDAFKQHASSLLKQQQIVLYCQSGNRAGQAAKYLDSLGYENVYNAGGFGTWTTRDASLKLKLSDTMAVSQLPAVSMKTSTTQIIRSLFSPQVPSIPRTVSKVIISRSVNPVQSARYFTFTGRIISVISDQKRVVSFVQLAEKSER